MPSKINTEQLFRSSFIIISSFFFFLLHPTQLMVQICRFSHQQERGNIKYILDFVNIWLDFELMINPRHKGNTQNQKIYFCIFFFSLLCSIRSKRKKSIETDDNFFFLFSVLFSSFTFHQSNKYLLIDKSNGFETNISCTEHLLKYIVSMFNRRTIAFGP